MADRNGQRLNIHSANGLTLVRSVACDPIPTGYFSIAALGEDSLIFASEKGGTFTVNHHSGQVTQTSSHKFKDTAVVAFNEETVLLSGSNNYENNSDVLVKALNIKTG